MIWFILIAIIIIGICGSLFDGLIGGLSGIAGWILSETTGKIIATIGIVSLAALITYKLTNLSLLRVIPTYGVVAIVLIIAYKIISYFWKN